MKRAFTALILSLTLLLTACDGPSYQAEELRGDPSAVSVSEEADLAGSIEIVHGDETVPYLPAAHAAADAPAARRIFLYERANQFDLLCHVPGAFMKVSPVPRDIAERYGLVQRRCAFASGRCRDVLVYRHDHTLTSLDRRLIDRIFAVKNEVALCEYD